MGYFLKAKPDFFLVPISLTPIAKPSARRQSGQIDKQSGNLGCWPFGRQKQIKTVPGGSHIKIANSCAVRSFPGQYGSFGFCHRVEVLPPPQSLHPFALTTLVPC